ncbi:Fpg/Nei family DNA glycosylase [Corynebacterium mendelii]|uniref:DNA-(apurinic or apyrimidinic site) lyase n=1 Tax=Corynebacterium mendelii TaxID=2765362 RepID=A0A939E1F4_9CORY|nr:Fpg/Nei family DNA glycosylase [Corynebacterium mendelii]MBN9644685.1 Fpg/Nei family DNA glycosylase [Corynebacterium mendelii]
MPEGDSVYQLARRLQFMAGRRVVSSSLRVPRYATVDFTGSVCRQVWPYGKHLFMAFGEQIMHTHLKMEGTWSVNHHGEKWRKPGFTARVVLVVDGGQGSGTDIEIVGHNLGLVEVFPVADYRQRMGYLGPDVLKQHWLTGGCEQAKQRILARPDRAVGAALLDQRNLAGVGNEYRAEICFLAGVHPATAVKDTDIDTILALTRKLMWDNRNSDLRVTTGVRRAGESTYVFGRYMKPCRRCGTPVGKGFLGGADRGGDDGELERVIWFCPVCQPVPDNPAG